MIKPWIATKAKLIVRPSNEPAAPSDCRAKDKADCVTLEAEPIPARIGPTLKR